MRSRASQASHFRAGLIALALAALVLFLGFNKGIPGRHHYTVNVVFPSAAGLLTGSSVHPGSPVRVAGVNIGEVDSIEKGKGSTAIVGLKITDAGRPIHTDATAKIRPRLFLEGNFAIELSPGSPSAPTIKDGGTIPVTQTARSVALYEVLNTFDRATRDDLRGLVKEFAATLDHGGAQGLRRTYRQAPGALRNVAVASEATLGTEPHDLSELVAASARTAAAVDSRRRDLAELITTFDRNATLLASRRRELARSIAGLDSLTHEAPSQLRAVDSATGPLTRFARASEQPLRESPPVLDAALPFLKVADQLVAPNNAPALVRDLRPTVHTLAAIEAPLGDLLSLVTPVTGCVRDHALPVLTSKLDDGQLSTGQRVIDEFLHASGGLVSSSQNFDGNGFYTRYSFGSGQDLVATGTGEQQTFAFGQYQGSRPAKPQQEPPFRPNAPCEDQAPTNLTAPVHNASTRTVARLNGSQMRDLAKLLVGDRSK